ncbi:MAG: FtsX-like permease family protein [Deltaproteobacteria bacterium]|nr:MAG: FtsX-like permease family protein [Deltaproteobacteria bacterium]TMQ08944.1 MAG: FtsX-like permease family protein [Deltaproteobacteria bacterium]
MNVFTTLKLAMRALWRNKVRSTLTMLGIVFGIGAVIAMVAGGQGAQQAVRDVFQSLGTNVLILTNGSQRSFGAAGGAGSRQSITWDDMKALQSGEIQSIRWVTPMLQTRTQVASEDANWNTSVIGTTAIWFQIRNWPAAQGTVFDEDSGDSNAKIAVIGKTVATQLYGTSNPVGQTIRISGQPYEVVGVLTSKGQGPMGDNDDTLVIPVKTYQQKIEKGLAKYIKGQVLISMTSDDLAERTMSQVTGLIRDRHKLDSSDEDDFRIRNPAEFAQAQQDSTQRIATLLAIVAAVSLFVGGIGVMNIMLVSVIERTREIGIRMAVGAKPIDVMTQFLVESLVLASVGGVLGLALGAAAAKYMAGYFGWKFFFPATTAAIAFFVAGGVGVVFGLYPAIRASRLDPITALRYET